MVNADVTQYMNEKKSRWLKLKVYDLLRQNVSIYRYSGESFIEDTQMNVLTRFFLLSLNVKLNKFGDGLLLRNANRLLFINKHHLRS